MCGNSFQRIVMHADIGIDEEEDLTTRNVRATIASRGGPDAGLHLHDLRSVTTGDFGGVVGGGVVHDDQLKILPGGGLQCVKRRPERFRGISCRHDHTH